MGKTIVRILVVIIVGLAFFTIYANLRDDNTIAAVLDTRFWHSGEEYKPFYSGVYVVGSDLEPGSYEVEIQGGVKHRSSVVICEFYKDEADNMQVKRKKHEITIRVGEKGFHMELHDGETIEVDIYAYHAMRIKKIG